MGNGATKSLAKYEVESHPLDASDVQTLDQAKAELVRVRKLLFANAPRHILSLEERSQIWLAHRKEAGYDVEESEALVAEYLECVNLMDDEINEVYAAAAAGGPEGDFRMDFAEFKASFSKLKVFTDGYATVSTSICRKQSIR